MLEVDHIPFTIEGLVSDAIAQSVCISHSEPHLGEIGTLYCTHSHASPSGVVKMARDFEVPSRSCQMITDNQLRNLGLTPQTVVQRNSART